MSLIELAEQVIPVIRSILPDFELAYVNSKVINNKVSLHFYRNHSTVTIGLVVILKDEGGKSKYRFAIGHFEKKENFGKFIQVHNFEEDEFLAEHIVSLVDGWNNAMTLNSPCIL